MQMCAFQLFLTGDPSLGRIDYNLLTDQALMEMFIEGFDEETKKKYQDKHGMYLDVCDWLCIECDEDDRVIEIDINSRHVSGSLDLFYAPPRVKELWISSLSGEVYNSELTGSIDFKQLPSGVECLTLDNNQLTREIDLTQLPNEMKALRLNYNQLTGDIELTKLPEGLNYLSLDSNQLTGEIDLTRLPARLYHLDLQNNQFTGEIDLTHLSEGMNYLYLNKNQLSGSFVVKNSSPGLRSINAEDNKFNAVAVIDSKSHAYIHLRGSGVTSVVDGNGRDLDSVWFLG